MALFGPDGRVSRPYSIASGTGEDILRFLIRRMPGGEVSEYLAGLQPGDQVRVSPPFGWFRPGEHAGQRPFAFLATGTGVAPFMSYLRSPGAVRPAAFLYGVRQADNRVDTDWLAKVGGVQCAVSREAVDGCHHGRITGLLPVALLSALVAVQTFADGQTLVIDARLAGVLAAVVALVLRAPFLVVVLVAAITAALLRSTGLAA